MTSAEGRTPLGDLKEDLRRYPRRPWFREQSVWALVIYRFGRWSEMQSGWRRHAADACYKPAYRVVETLTGITLPRRAEVGPGCRIHHFGGIVIHEGAVIGARCTLRHNVTIGERHSNDRVPRLDDDVDVGAGAVILGDISIGAGAQVGASSVVLIDVPPGATVAGNPGRVVRHRTRPTSHK